MKYTSEELRNIRNRLSGFLDGWKAANEQEDDPPVLLEALNALWFCEENTPKNRLSKMADALEDLLEDIIERGKWDGECNVVCCGNGVFTTAQEVLAEYKKEITQCQD